MHEPMEYEVFKELFKAMGVNPYEFRKLSGGNVIGYFPDLTERTAKISTKRLASVLWGKASLLERLLG